MNEKILPKTPPPSRVLNFGEQLLFRRVMIRLGNTPGFKGIYSHEIESRIREGKSLTQIYEECLKISLEMTEEEIPF